MQPQPEQTEEQEQLPAVPLVRARREFVIFAIAAVAGVLLVPILIWVVGRYALGPYAHGGAGALLADFFDELAHGAPASWAVALGPYVMTLVGRFLIAQARSAS